MDLDFGFGISFGVGPAIQFHVTLAKLYGGNLFSINSYGCIFYESDVSAMPIGITSAISSGRDFWREEWNISIEFDAIKDKINSSRQ